VYVHRSGIGKQVKITLIAALAFILILAAPVAMTTMAYAADDGSPKVDPVGSGGGRQR
jgi:hypothetical protein